MTVCANLHIHCFEYKSQLFSPTQFLTFQVFDRKNIVMVKGIALLVVFYKIIHISTSYLRATVQTPIFSRVMQVISCCNLGF